MPPKPNNVTFNCNWCGEETTQKASRYHDGRSDKGHFCSKTCFGHHKRSLNRVTLVCPICEEEFTLTKHFYKKRLEGATYGKLYCSRACFRESKTPIKHRPDDVTFDCEWCGKETTVTAQMFRRSERHYCGRECSRLAKILPGSAGYYGPWRENRRKRLEMDGHRCKLCKTHKENLDVRLHVHHIIPVRLFDDPNEAHRIDNLLTLCARCHKKVELETLRPAN